MDDTKHLRYIDPLEELGKELLGVEKPGRYVGGEYGCLAKKDADLRLLIAFPDLYEIGMSNQALRILYNRLNELPGLSCDRAFAPAPDFEGLLRRDKVPLYGLDTGISLASVDLLLFTLGYELGITGVLAMLDLAGIPLRAAARSEAHPLVIMGGPCVANPLPYASFMDAFWIGEAEGGFFSLVQELQDLKRAGGRRGALLERLVAHPSVWTRNKKRALRALDREFAFREARPAVFPVPNMKVVQHHGVVEIMRGCPHGCRFCHAGYWYRPMRQKSADAVHAEVAACIALGGYREISLSSLSSGDYQYLASLVDSLHTRYGEEHISFQLPSLRVSTFSLPLLEKIAAVRKSGLTFAVETPVEAWQHSLNKEVARDTVAAIVQEAKQRGFRGAKFYFMIGLPPAQDGAPQRSEEEEIVAFILEIARRTGMHFTINVGTFVPKPHTPYQWAAQMDEETARAKLDYIRSSLKPRGHKVGTQDPFLSVLEGIISRGDERVGDLIEGAYRSGCRLDAWQEHIRRDQWRGLLSAYDRLAKELLRERNRDRPLPWQRIEPGMAPGYAERELACSTTHTLTPPCTEECTHRCGICREAGALHKNDKNLAPTVVTPPQRPPVPAEGPVWRIIFAFAKQGKAVFYPHLALVEIFTMAMTRAGIPARYTQGFNPQPHLEFAAPLPLGMAGQGEIAAIETRSFFSAQTFKQALCAQLPPGLTVGEAIPILIPWGVKKWSLASVLWGYSYETAQGDQQLVPAGMERAYRLSREGNLWGVQRRAVLAAAPQDRTSPASYFAVYREHYAGPWARRP